MGLLMIHLKLDFPFFFLQFSITCLLTLHIRNTPLRRLTAMFQLFETLKYISELNKVVVKGM